MGRRRPAGRGSLRAQLFEAPSVDQPSLGDTYLGSSNASLRGGRVETSARLFGRGSAIYRG